LEKDNSHRLAYVTEAQTVPLIHVGRNLEVYVAAIKRSPKLFAKEHTCPKGALSYETIPTNLMHVRSTFEDSLGASPALKSDGKSYITSRSFRVPSEAKEMRHRVWFNMWRSQHWPYVEPQSGSTLFWYDRALEGIVWKSRIIQIERFKYENKEVAREYILQRFDSDVITD
jgi:hypothetical protein